MFVIARKRSKISDSANGGACGELEQTRKCENFCVDCYLAVGFELIMTMVILIVIYIYIYLCFCVI